MLQEKLLLGTVDKVAAAIELLKSYEPPEGYYVCFSGGKDSVVILDLVKRAGVKFEAHHHIMTIEPPELMQFIFKQYPDVINDHPPKTMHQLILQYGFPPIRIVRYCCWELKANNGNNRIKVTGVRAEESPRCAKFPKVEIKENGGELRLIHDWTAAEVWEYIHARNLPYCKLYDEGKKRIGCVFCPFARESENIENALKYPQFVRYFITACDRAIKTRLAKGKDSKYKTGAEMFIAWIEGGRGKKLKDFGVMFDYEKGGFVMKNNVFTISLADFNAILSHAERVGNGEFDMATILRGELKNKLKIKNASPFINAVWNAAKKPEVDVQKETRLYLAQFNLIVEGEGVNYRLVKRGDDSCYLEPIIENTAAIIPAENSNAPTLDTANELDALSVEQLTMEAKFYFAQMGQNAIEFGKRLIAIKKKLPHGEWGNWLKDNFNLSQSSANKLMEVSRRFSNSELIPNLGYTQMLQIISLPEGEEQNFFDKMASEGKDVRDMTIKNMNAEIKKYKAEAEKNKQEAEKYKAESEAKEAEIENQYEQLNNLRNENVKLWEENSEAEINANKLQKENEYLKNNPVEVEVVPPDYEANKKKIAELQDKIVQLEKKLAEPVVEVEVMPSDYEEVKKELAELKGREEKYREEIATSQALNQFFMMANFLQEHKDSLLEVLKGYVETDGLTAQRINQIAFVSSLLKKILKDIS